MIKIVNLTKSYKNEDNVIDNINLEIKDGEIFGFIGQNGAGKTTTIKMITGILQIDNGDIFIDGKSIKKEPVEAKKNLGLVPDSPDIFLKFKGIEYLNFIADCYNVGKQERIEKIEKLSKEFDIYGDLENKIESYSHGMRQKIVIIGTLLHNPQNWILDEPLTGLDPTSIYQVKECMREHASKGNIVFFSSHLIDIVEKLCDRIAIIKHGEIQVQTTIQDIESSGKTLEEFYLNTIGDTVTQTSK